MIDARRRARGVPLDELPRRPRRVDDVGGRHGAVGKYLWRAARLQRLENAGHAPFRGRTVGDAAEQALDPQHVRARRIQRKPFAQQLRRGIGALRIRRLLLGVRLARAAVEHEIGAVVHQRRTMAAGGARQVPHRKRIDVERLERALLRRVHVGERRAVDDDVGAQPIHRTLAPLMSLARATIAWAIISIPVPG